MTHFLIHPGDDVFTIAADDAAEGQASPTDRMFVPLDILLGLLETIAGEQAARADAEEVLHETDDPIDGERAAHCGRCCAVAPPSGVVRRRARQPQH